MLSKPNPLHECTRPASAFAVAAVLAATLSFIATSAASAQEAAPQPFKNPLLDKKLPTGREVMEQLTAHGRKVMTGHFRQAGKKGDAKVDDAAAAFLDLMARYLAVSHVDSFYGPEDLPALPELIARGQAVLDAGCDDPLVQFCQWRLLDEVGKSEDGIALLTACVRPQGGLNDRGYAPRFAAEAVCRLHWRTGKPAYDATIHALSRIGPKDGNDAERRMALALIRRMVYHDDQFSQIAEMMRAQPDADPWLSKTLYGIAMVNKGWQARSTKLAADVNDDQWKRFFSALSVARDELTAAWKLAPQLPDPAIVMISVAMGAGSQLDEDPLEWFRRAVVAEADHRQAYSNMVHAARPRWGGSMGMMIGIGLLGLEDPRFDTAIPRQLLMSIISLDDEFRGNGHFIALADPKINELACRMFDGYIAAGGPRTAYFRTFKAYALSRIGKWAEARAELDALTKAGLKPDRLAAETFKTIGMLDAIDRVYAMTCSESAAVGRAAGQLNSGGDAKAAAAALRAARAKLPAGDPAIAGVDVLVRQADAAAALAAGEWAPMKCATRLAEFERLEGVWTVDDGGRIRGEMLRTNRFKILFWRPPAGVTPTADDAVEVSVVVRAAGRFNPAFTQGGGPHFDCDDAGKRTWVQLDPVTGDLEIPHLLPKPIRTKGRDGSTLLVRVADGRMTVWVDGVQAGEPIDVRANFRGPYELGLSADGYVEAMFENPQVRISKRR